MSNIVDKDLYELAKSIIFTRYKKNSAYRSGALVSLYKSLGGRYRDSKNKKGNINDKPLKRWFLERWENIDPNRNESSYPVYRPTRRITEQTPKTIDEIPMERILQQSKLKQKYKGKKNLPKF